MNVQDWTRLPGACATETWLDETICFDLRRPRSCGCGQRFGVAAAGGDGCLHGRRPRGLTLQALDGRLRRYGSVPDLLAECDAVRAVRATPPDPARQRARYMTPETMAPLSVRQGIGPPDQFLILLTPLLSLPVAR